VGGGVVAAWELFAPAMMRAVEQRSATYRLSGGLTRIEQTKLGNNSGIYGAAYLPWIEQRTTTHA
jgi:glucokinase